MIVGRGGAELDSAQVLDALVSVLAGADQSERATVLDRQRRAVEPIGDQHVLGDRVLQRQHGTEAVAADCANVSDLCAGP